MSYSDTDIDKRISTLTQDESFHQTEKILGKLKNEIVDVHKKEQVTTLLNNLESLKTIESNEVTEHIDTVYKQLLQFKTQEAFELTEEEITSITKLTEVVWWFKTELFNLKEEVSYTWWSPLDRNDDESDEDVDSGYRGDSPLDNKTRKPLLDIPKGSWKELFTKKNALKRGWRALVGLWWVLTLRRIRKWLKKRRERKKLEKAKNNPESSKNTTTKAPKKKSKFWRRTLGILWIWGWVYARSKFRKWDWSFKKLRDWLKWKETGPDINPVLDDEKTAAKAFDALLNWDKEAQEKAKKYTTIWDNINKFSNDIYSFSDGTINKVTAITELWMGKDKYAGAIPYVMDNTYENIDEMNSKTSLFQLMAKADSNELITEIKRRATEGIDEKNLMVKAILRILWYKTLKEFVDGWWNKIDKEKVDEVNMVFQKALKVMAYIDLAENTYIMKQITWKDIQKKAWEDKDGDTQWENIVKPTDADSYAKLVQKILDNPDEYRVGTSGDYKDVEAIREGFRDKKILDIAALDIKLSDIKDANLDVYKNIAKIDQDRDAYHKDIENGHGDKVMETLMESCEDELSNSIFASLTRAMPLTTLLELTGAWSEADLKKKYLKNSWFKKLIQSYKDRFEKSWTLSYDEQKQVVDEYLTLLKEINTTTATLQEIRDKNGNYRLTISSTFSHLIWNTKHAFTTWLYLGVDAYNDYKNGNYAAGTWKFVMGTFYVAWALGVTMMWLWSAGRILSRGKGWWKMFKAGKKLALAPITVPAHIVQKYSKVWTLRHRLSKYLPHGVLKELYTWEKLSNALANGLPFSKAYKAYASNGLKLKNHTNLSRDDFFKRIFKTKESTANDILGKYLFTTDAEGHEIPAKDANAIWKKFRRKFISTTPLWKVNKFTLTDEFLTQIKPLADQITEWRVLRKFASDLSLKQMSQLSKMFKAHPEILNLLNQTSDDTKLQTLIDQVISDHRAWNIPKLDQLKLISWVDTIKDLTDSQKILRSTIETNIDDITHDIKTTKKQLLNKVWTKVKYNTIEWKITKIQWWNVFIETRAWIEVPINEKQLLDSNLLKIDNSVLMEFEQHKKDLQQIVTNIDTWLIDKNDVSTLTKLFNKTSNNFGVQKRLIKNLANDWSEIHDAIKAFQKTGPEAEEAGKTIKKLLKITRWDEFIREGISWILKDMKYSKYMKLLKWISYVT